jgi:hypothetical protein
VTGWLRAHWSRLAAGAALAAVASVAGVISYTHVEWLTLALHGTLLSARLMPFGVDGLVVVGSVVLMTAGPGYAWLGWLCVVPGAGASIFANVESGLRYGPLAAAWSGVPAVSFALAVFTFERWLFSQRSRPAVTPGEALQTLLASASQRQLADMLGVPRARVQAWASRPAGEELAEVDDDAA